LFFVFCVGGWLGVGVSEVGGGGGGVLGGELNTRIFRIG